MGQVIKNTGIVRRLDELGRITLPIELRRNLDIGEKDPVEIYVSEDMIILKKYAPFCVFCGEQENLTLYKDKNICKKCIAEISEQGEF